MKLSFLFILFLILGSYCPTLFSQQSTIPTGKNVVSSQCGETVFYLITEKNKTGLYNSTTSSYIIEPVQNFFYYFDTYNLLFTCSAFGKIEVYNVAELEKGLAPHPLTLSSYSNNPIIYSFGSDNFDENKLILKDGYLKQYKSKGMIFLKDSSAIYNKLTAINSGNNFYFGFEKYNNTIIITDFKDRDTQSELKPIASVQYPDEDSISADGYVLYYNRKPGYQRTGLYNISTGNWDIPKQYARIYKVNNLFICLKYGMDEIVEYENSYFDFYVLQDEKIVTTGYQNMQTNGGFPLKYLFEDGTYSVDRDSSFVYFQAEQGLGLARVQLFHPYWDEYGYNVILGVRENFIIDTLLEAKYDLILKSGRDISTFVTKVGEQFTFHFIPDHSDSVFTFPISFNKSFGISDNIYQFNTYTIDGKFYRDTSSTEIPQLTEIESKHLSDLDYEKLIRVLDDSLIYVQHWIKQSTGTYSEPGIGIRVEDSDEYYYREQGGYESGIYDMKNKRWLINPDQAYIINAPQGYLVCAPVLAANGNLIHYSYTFRDKANNILKTYESFDSLVASDLIDSYVFSELNISSKKMVDSEIPNYYYYQTGTKYGLLDMEGFKTIAKPFDFIYFNAFREMLLTVNGKNVSVNWNKNNAEIAIDTNFNLSLIHTTSNIVLVQTIQNEKFILYFNENGDEFSKVPYEGSNFQKYCAEDVITTKSFKLISLKDNLLYIEDWSDDKTIEDVESPENFLTDFKGEVKRTKHNVSGHGRSGILNLVTREWFIEPENIWIKMTIDGNFLIKKKILGKKSELQTVYSLINANGDFIFENITEQELPANYKKLAK